MKNYFIKLRFLFLIILFIGVFGLAKSSWAATITANSCSFADVNYAVNTLASRGDTIKIPAGNCTWFDGLFVYKALSIIGAGAGKTIITSMYPRTTANPNNRTMQESGTVRNIYPHAVATIPLGGDCASLATTHLINIVSTDPKADADVLVRVSGMTFNLDAGDGYGGNGGAIKIVNAKPHLSWLNAVEVDNNIINGARTGWGAWPSEDWGTTYPLDIRGHIKGVIDNNTINGSILLNIGGGRNYFSDPAKADHNADGCWAQGELAWKYGDAVYGQDDMIFIEDNTFNEIGKNTGVFFDFGGGSNMVVRYNTFNFIPGTSATILQGTQNHGSACGILGGKLVEQYGNYYNNTSVLTSNFSLGLNLGRATKNMVFNNYAKMGASTQDAYISVVNEYDKRWLGPYFKSFTSCETDVVKEELPTACLYESCPTYMKSCDTGKNPQSVYKTYGFLNWYGTTGTTLAKTYADAGDSNTTCGNYSVPAGSTPRQGIDWFQDYSVSSPTGVTCGVTVPAGSCSTGQAKWVTSQSCSTITTADVGAGGNIDNKKRTGTLYRCDSTNSWKAWYTPYTYPHPLRGGTTNTAPASPTGVTVR